MSTLAEYVCGCWLLQTRLKCHLEIIVIDADMLSHQRPAVPIKDKKSESLILLFG